MSLADRRRTKGPASLIDERILFGLKGGHIPEHSQRHFQWKVVGKRCDRQHGSQGLTVRRQRVLMISCLEHTSVLSGVLERIDHEHLNRAAAEFELQAKLFLESCSKGRQIRTATLDSE